MRAVLLLAAAAAASTALLGCTPDPQGLTAAELEGELAALYPAADDRTRVRVRCPSPLDPQVGATQDCRVRVGKDRATVRATVTEETEDGPRFETAPVLSSERVAKELLGALLAEEYVVGEVVCAGELVGVKGRTVECTATPPDNGRRTRLEARVGSVDGLDVRIRYRAAR